MSIDYTSVLIIGYILPIEEYDEDAVIKLTEILDCEYCVFNDGYDTPFHYVFVPKKLKKYNEINIFKDIKVLTELFDELKLIKEKADKKKIKLPDPVITSKLCVW